MPKGCQRTPKEIKKDAKRYQNDVKIDTTCVKIMPKLYKQFVRFLLAVAGISQKKNYLSVNLAGSFVLFAFHCPL